MPFDTPLRYPGGKGRLSAFMKQVVELNKLEGGEYVELYAGGAGIAVSLLLNGVISHIHINDINKSINSFWHAVTNHSKDLCKKIISTDVTIDEWYRQKEIQENLDSDPLDLAFSTFFLNRTNRSGIINGGVIGGKSQAGQWTLDARYNKEDLVSRIKKIAAAKNQISVYRQDAADFIEKTLPHLGKKTLVYLDPPYYVKGKGLYQNHYEHADHAEIARLIRKIRQPWVVTYDNVPEIVSLYEKYPQAFFGLQYSAQSKYSGTEILISKPKLKLPDSIAPTRSLSL